MDRQTQSANDFRALRVLCDESGAREDQQKLLQPLCTGVSSNPSAESCLNRSARYFPEGLFPRRSLRIHLNNRGFPDTDVDKYFQPHGTSRRLGRTGLQASELHERQPPIATRLHQAAGNLRRERRSYRGLHHVFPEPRVRRPVREYLMQSVTSAHYEILCPPGALTQDAEEFAKQRETLFTALEKLGDTESNSEIRIVLDPIFPPRSPRDRPRRPTR